LRRSKSEWKHLVGKNIDDVNVSELPNPHRILRGECVASMDYNPDRLSIYCSADGLVTSIAFG
jgi:hypothetical protein